MSHLDLVHESISTYPIDSSQARPEDCLTLSCLYCYFWLFIKTGGDLGVCISTAVPRNNATPGIESHVTPRKINNNQAETKRKIQTAEISKKACEEKKKKKTTAPSHSPAHT